MPPKHFQPFPTATNASSHGFNRQNFSHQTRPVQPRNLVEYQSYVAQQWAQIFIPSIQKAMQLVLAPIMSQVKDQHQAHIMGSVSEALADRLLGTGSLVTKRDIEDLVREGHKSLVLDVEHAIARAAAVGAAITAPVKEPADAVEVHAGESNTSAPYGEKLVQAVDKLGEELTSLRREVESLRRDRMEASKPSSKGSRSLGRQRPGGNNVSGPITRSQSQSQRQKSSLKRRKRG